jgi:hypothetical protein
MMRNLILAVSALAVTVPVIPAAAMAHDRPSYSREYRSNHGQYQRGYDNRRYDNRRAYDRGRYCKKSDGTTGLLVGGAAGVLAGRAIDSRGDRTTGTVLGAALGALLGRHVERNVIDDGRCR